MNRSPEASASELITWFWCMCATLTFLFCFILTSNSQVHHYSLGQHPWLQDGFTDTKACSSTCESQRQIGLATSQVGNCITVKDGNCIYSEEIAVSPFQGHRVPSQITSRDEHRNHRTMEMLSMQGSLLWLPSVLRQMWTVMGEMCRSRFCTTKAGIEQYNGILMPHQQINGTLATIGPTTNGFSLREGVNHQGQDQEGRQKVHPRQREKDLEKPQKNHQVLDHLPCHHMPLRAPHG